VTYLAICKCVIYSTKRGKIRSPIYLSGLVRYKKADIFCETLDFHGVDYGGYCNLGDDAV